MYLVVIAILSIVLALPEPLDRWVLLREPWQVLTAVSVATLLPFAAAAGVNHRALRLLEEQPEDPGLGQYTFGRGMALLQALLGIGHGAVLLCTRWMAICSETPVVGRWPLLPGALSVLPFLISILLVWIAVYPTDRAIRRIALEVYLFRGRPVHPVWPLGTYLAYSFRHQVLFILVPMFLILAARDVVEMYEGRLSAIVQHAYLPDVLLGAAAAVIAVIAPVLLRHIWVTQPLPEGPLRDRLLRLCDKLRLRCREILIWRSGGMLVNAAVMGLIAPLRYVLITDAMLEQMDDRKIEAVFGHEAGHVKRHHILFFLLFAMISGCLVTVLSIYTRHLPPAKYELVMVAAGAALLVKWSLLFGWISRRFERQADVFGVRTLALSGLPCEQSCALHAVTGVSAPLDRVRVADPLCSTAANLFGDTLNEVALLNGIPPESRSWRHSSISSRSRFLQTLAADPRATQRFERRLFYVKVAILLAAAASAAWAGWELRLWKLLGL